MVLHLKQEKKLPSTGLFLQFPEEQRQHLPKAISVVHSSVHKLMRRCALLLCSPPRFAAHLCYFLLAPSFFAAFSSAAFRISHVAAPAQCSLNRGHIRGRKLHELGQRACLERSGRGRVWARLAAVFASERLPAPGAGLLVCPQSRRLCRGLDVVSRE